MVARILNGASSSGLHLDILPGPTRSAFLELAKCAFLKSSGWYLAGGTALALQVGHRQSVDLDFFTKKLAFRETGWERKLLATKRWRTTSIQSGTIYGEFIKAKVSFIAYPFFLPSGDWLKYGHMSILKPDDIAVMKIIAVSQRGRKRDFVDLYWYCLNFGDLTATISRALKQYPGQEHNLPHILKSLTYFDDAEKDPNPPFRFFADWSQIKAYFRREVPRITREFLGLR